jgi:hypothetical protein
MPVDPIRRQEGARIPLVSAARAYAQDLTGSIAEATASVAEYLHKTSGLDVQTARRTAETVTSQVFRERGMRTAKSLCAHLFRQGIPRGKALDVVMNFLPPYGFSEKGAQSAAATVVQGVFESLEARRSHKKGPPSKKEPKSEELTWSCQGTDLQSYEAAHHAIYKRPLSVAKREELKLKLIRVAKALDGDTKASPAKIEAVLREHGFTRLFPELVMPVQKLVKRSLEWRKMYPDVLG